MSIVHREIAEGIFQLSSDTFPLSTEPGKASRNAYLVKGEEYALLFDLSLEEPELFAYASRLADKPVRLVLSHGHVDHIYHLSSCKEAWLHQGDERLLREGCVFQRPVKPCPHLHFLCDGERIELGERTLQTVHIPGHTDGSILLWDERSGLLLSGDTVARRLLYGIHSFVPFADFRQNLMQLKKLPIRQIYSVHDRCALPFDHLDLMIECLSPETLENARRITIPLLGRFIHLTAGEENSLRYFDLVALCRRKRHEQEE